VRIYAGFSFAFFTLTPVNAAFTGVNHVMGDVSPPPTTCEARCSHCHALKGCQDSLHRGDCDAAGIADHTTGAEGKAGSAAGGIAKDVNR